MTALKYANQIRSALPKAHIYELFADMRTMGKGCEELYSETSKKKVMFMMFDQENDLPKIRKVSADNGCEMIVELNEKLSGRPVEIPADMVILMVGMEGPENIEDIAHAVGVSLCGNKFFIEKHPKLDPIATTTNGVYIAGTCHGPKDIPDSVSQAKAAAVRVLRNIVKGTVPIEVITARINKFLCTGCKMCISVCPYTAINFEEEKNVSVINEILCQGCGACVALCRPKAINQQGYSHNQIMAELGAVING